MLSPNRSLSHLSKLVLEAEPLIFSRCRLIPIRKQSVFMVTIKEIKTDRVKTFWRTILLVFYFNDQHLTKMQRDMFD